MKLPIEVSICCAFYNRAEFVQESIDSLLRQNYDYFEVIVVNDGSTDPKTKVILDSYQDSRLKVIHQQNSGFVAAIKNAITQAAGKYIAIHGAGDISYPDRIAKQASFLDNNGKVGAVSCYFENTVFGGKHHGSTKISQPKTLMLTSEDFAKKLNPFSHGEVMFRADIYHRVGGYRDFFKFAQDRDLWLRMSEVCQMGIVPDILYQRREFTSDGISTNREKLILQKYLSTFALLCFEERKIEGIDLLDKYGHAGVFFRRRNKVLAKFCVLQAIESLHQSKMEDANRIIALALQEKTSLLGISALVAIKLSKYSVFKRVFQSLISFHPNSKNWNRS